MKNKLLTNILSSFESKASHKGQNVKKKNELIN